MNDIEINELYKSFKVKKNTVQAIDGLSLSIEKGDIYGLLGPNGAGKTTTIKILLGLIAPDKGLAMVKGLDVNKHYRKIISHSSAILEGNRNIYWRLSAMENIEYFATIRGQGGRKTRERAEVLLQRLNLFDRRNDTVKTFSRGMQQKVALACSLITNPDILYLDEPTLGLDFASSLEIISLIKDLTESEGKTVIITTHAMDIAQKLCKTIGVIDKGKLLLSDSMESVKKLFKADEYEIHIKENPTKKLISQLNKICPLDVEKNTNGSVLKIIVHNGNMLYDFLNTLHENKITLEKIDNLEPDLGFIYQKVIETKGTL